jgi:DNA-binding transcriptional ArsR family regulator
MEHLPLTPATQAVLKALAEIGEGNVHDLSEKSGKARSTTDKAIRTLADAGLIVEIDTGADPAEGTPVRWTLSEATAAELAAADLGDEPTAGPDEPEVADPETEPGPTGDDNPAIGTDAGETGDGHDAPEEDGSDSDTDNTDTDVTGDDQKAPDGGGPDSDAGEASDGQDAPEKDGSDSDTDYTQTASGAGGSEVGGGKTVVVPSRPGDRKVMAIKGVLADHSDGAIIEVIVAESGISHPTSVRLLAAMEQADAARRLPPKPGDPERWIAGPTKASEVDPNPEPPRCALCSQVIRGVTSTPAAVASVQSLIRPDATLHVVGTDDEVHVVKLPTRLPPRPLNSTPSTVGHRSDVTVNADGRQPFGRGELERLTVGVLAANPGRPMTPQEIATAISAELGGRNVSSGAVRDNCTKAAAAGNIQLVSEAPLTFVFPKLEDDSSAEDEAGGEQADPADKTEDGTNPAEDGGERAEHTDSDQDASNTEQS